MTNLPGGTLATERAVWTRVDGVGDEPLDLFEARIGRGHFAMHIHDEYSIGACTEGVEVIRYKGSLHYLGPGTVVVVEPGEPHTGGPAGEDGFAYNVMYPAVSLFPRDRPYFPKLVFEDSELALQLRAAHGSLCRGDDPLEAESRLTAVLAALVRRHARPDRRPVAAVAGKATAQLVMARLEDEIGAPPTLAEIAADLGLSRFQVVRGFRESMGMPPYAWLAQRRVARARVLLAAGLRPSEVAGMVGFADQAHMTRWFRRVIGVTPGTYRNSVQDNGGPR
ncbi:AraC family transcriptional regulator [Fodinicola feengrottensis]|uniref:AraC family transcriptional regulator n=1 Tax=Fodinicola feengrottensis TaxID=435914 RepID=A0ABN2FZT6_9ACTN